MLIRVNAGDTVSVEDIDDFKRFKLVSMQAPELVSTLAHALQGLATLDGTERAWVDADALALRVGRAGDAAWMEKYRAMIEGARKYGWVRDEPLAIGAHIEWQSP